MLITTDIKVITRKELLRGGSESWDGILFKYKGLEIHFEFHCINGSYCYSSTIFKSNTRIGYCEENNITNLKKVLFKMLKKENCYV